MNADIIDWEKTPRGSDVEILSVFYAFKNISEYIARGNDIYELKLKIGREYKVTEVGFREFLKMIVSIDWDEKELGKNKTATLNKIFEYLKTPIKQDEQPIVQGESITLEQLKEKYRGGE